MTFLRLYLSILSALLLAGCTTQPRPAATITWGGNLWSSGQRNAGVLFQDGGQSIPIPGGSLWLFGDTFYGQPNPSQPPQNSQIRGAHWATLAQLPADAANLPPALNYVTTPNNTPLNPLTLLPGEDPKHRRIWPAGGIHLNGRTYLYYSLVATTDAPGPWNFQDVGGGLAVTTNLATAFTRLQPSGNWQFPVEPIQVLSESNTLYLCEVSTKPRGLIIARTSTDQIENPTTYQFFNGHGWSPRHADARVVLREAAGQVSIIKSAITGEYLIATSSDFFHPREIQLRRAKQLTGPWSAPQRFTVPELPGQKTQLVYCTFLHPELTPPGSRDLPITYCRQLTGEWNLSNPEWAVLRLIPE